MGTNGIGPIILETRRSRLSRQGNLSHLVRFDDFEQESLETPVYPVQQRRNGDSIADSGMFRTPQSLTAGSRTLWSVFDVPITVKEPSQYDVPTHAQQTDDRNRDGFVGTCDEP